MSVVGLPGNASVFGKIFFEGRCPESHRLAFLAPFQRSDGKARYHVVLFEIMSVAQAKEEEQAAGMEGKIVVGPAIPTKIALFVATANSFWKPRTCSSNFTSSISRPG